MNEFDMMIYPKSEDIKISNKIWIFNSRHFKNEVHFYLILKGSELSKQKIKNQSFLLFKTIKHLSSQ